MSHSLPFYQVRLPIAVSESHRELEQLQHLLQGVAQTLRPEMEKRGLNTRCFHHHTDEGKNESKPPLVLYQRSGQTPNSAKKYATLTAFGDAAEAVKWLLENMPRDVIWNQRKNMLVPMSIVEKTVEINTAHLPLREYKVFEYLPLSGLKKNGQPKSNWEKYKDAEDFAARLQLLQHLLADHLRTLVETAWGIKPLQPVRCHITEITKITHDMIKSKGHSWAAFHLTFACNWQLPNDCAIGNRIAMGYGKLQLLPESVLPDTERYKSLRRLEKKYA
jgi:hypothetical protein